jgi:hypothetical protein
MAFKSVFDPAFKYRTAISTDIRKTFERVRRGQRLDQQEPRQERRLKVVPIQHEERRRKVISMPADVQLHRVK